MVLFLFVSIVSTMVSVGFVSPNSASCECVVPVKQIWHYLRSYSSIFISTRKEEEPLLASISQERVNSTRFTNLPRHLFCTPNAATRRPVDTPGCVGRGAHAQCAAFASRAVAPSRRARAEGRQS